MGVPKKRRDIFDQYGFPLSSTAARGAQLDVVPENKRAKRWENLLALSAGVLPEASPAVKKCVRGGIPNSLRGQMWFHYCGASARMKAEPTRYRTCYSEGKAKISPQLWKEISADIKTVFPQNFNYAPVTVRMEDGSLRLTHSTTSLKLRRVMLAFTKAMWDRGYGWHYQPALTRIAGLLLIFVDRDEHVFWMLDVLVMSMMRTSYYYMHPTDVSATVLDCVLDQQALWSLVGERLPRYTDQPGNRFKPAQEVTHQHLTYDWFMNLYVDYLPMETLLRVWDCFWYEGSKTLFRAALAVMANYKGAPHSKATLVSYLDEATMGATDGENVIDLMFSPFTGPCASLSSQTIAEHRKKAALQQHDNEVVDLLPPTACALQQLAISADTDQCDPPAKSMLQQTQPKPPALPVPLISTRRHEPQLRVTTTPKVVVADCDQPDFEVWKRRNLSASESPMSPISPVVFPPSAANGGESVAPVHFAGHRKKPSVHEMPLFFNDICGDLESFQPK